MSAEPISTRIARLKGCEPVSDGDGGWMCQCALNKHGDWCAQCSDRHEYIDEAWLTPAASFALLAELSMIGTVAIGRNNGMTAYRLMIGGLTYGDWSPTLGEAIALAYEAYVAAKAARQ